GSPFGRADAGWRDRSAEAAESWDREGCGDREMDRGRSPVPELQAAAVFRHACALFQSYASKPARRASIRTRAGECATRCECDHSTASTGHLRGVALSVRRKGRRIRLCWTPDRAAPTSKRRRLAARVAGGRAPLGEFSPRVISIQDTLGEVDGGRERPSPVRGDAAAARAARFLWCRLRRGDTAGAGDHADLAWAGARARKRPAC